MKFLGDHSRMGPVVELTGDGGAAAPPLRFRVAAVACAALAAIAVSGCGSGAGPSVASVLGQAPITESMLKHRITIVRGRLHGEAAKTPPSRVRERALRFLIRAEWVQGEATAERVRVGQREVEQRYEEIVSGRLSSPLADVLQTPDMSRADGLLDVRIALLEERLHAQVTAQAGGVSDMQVAAYYYHAHAHEFTVPASRRAFVVVTASEANARRAKRALRAGVSPAAVAKRYSVDPGSRSSGGLVTYARDEPAPALNRALFAARIGALSGPVAVPSAGAFYVFRVLSATGRHARPLNEVASKIRQTLALREQQRAYEAFADGFQRRWRRRTSCRGGYVIAECRNYAATGSRG
jgi:hypothetical protein